MVREITKEAKQLKPDIKVNVHTIPWRKDDFGNAIKYVIGQDFSKIAEYVDILSPMAYAHMVKREPGWINSVVGDVSDQADCKIIPSIQVNKAYLSNPLTIGEFEQSIKEALKPPSSGVFFWSWEQLENKPEKKEVLKKIMDSLK